MFPSPSRLALGLFLDTHYFACPCLNTRQACSDKCSRPLVVIRRRPSPPSSDDVARSRSAVDGHGQRWPAGGQVASRWPADGQRVASGWPDRPCTGRTTQRSRGVGVPADSSCWETCVLARPVRREWGEPMDAGCLFYLSILPSFCRSRIAVQVLDTQVKSFCSDGLFGLDRMLHYVSSPGRRECTDAVGRKKSSRCTAIGRKKKPSREKDKSSRAPPSGVPILFLANRTEPAVDQATGAAEKSKQARERPARGADKAIRRAGGPKHSNTRSGVDGATASRTAGCRRPRSFATSAEHFAPAHWYCVPAGSVM